MNSKKRILLIRPDKAGDALKTLPVLRRAVAQRPDWEWHVLASPHNLSLFETEPHIHIHPLPAQWEALSREEFLEAAGLQTPFAIAVSLLCDRFEYSHQILCHTLAEKKFAVDPSPRLRWEIEALESGPAGRCESQNIASLLEQALHLDLGGEFERAAPILNDEDRKEALERMGQKHSQWIGFCPFAGLANRSHSHGRWKAFVQRAVKSHSEAHFFLFSGPGEVELLERWRKETAHPERVTVCSPSTFRTLGAYLRRLDGVVAVDSGPLHLARALNVPSLGILSGGDWKRWFPSPGPQDELVRRGFWNRFPSTASMFRALTRWTRQLNPTRPQPQ